MDLFSHVLSLDYNLTGHMKPDNWNMLKCHAYITQVQLVTIQYLEWGKRQCQREERFFFFLHGRGTQVMYSIMFSKEVPQV